MTAGSDGSRPNGDRDAGATGEVVGDRLVWRTLVGMYPPSWRTRYGDELLALLGDSAPTGPRDSLRTVASLCGGAVGAWLAPRRQLHTVAARLRATLAVLLVTWITLAAAALIFGQLNEQQATQTVTPGHPITGQLFSAYTAAAHISVAVLFAGCAPLFVQLVRNALRRRDLRGLVLLATPLAVPVLFLAVLVVTSRIVRQPHGGVGAGWFFVLASLGLLAGAGAVSGPLLALRRFSPTGRAVRLAVYGVVTAVAVMGAALIASVADLATVRAWGQPDFVHAPLLVIVAYGALVVAALAVATTSGVRGLAAHAG